MIWIYHVLHYRMMTLKAYIYMSIFIFFFLFPFIIVFFISIFPFYTLVLEYLVSFGKEMKRLICNGVVSFELNSRTLLCMNIIFSREFWTHNWNLLVRHGRICAKASILQTSCNTSNFSHIKEQILLNSIDFPLKNLSRLKG